MATVGGTEPPQTSSRVPDHVQTRGPGACAKPPSSGVWAAGSVWPQLEHPSGYGCRQGGRSASLVVRRRNPGPRASAGKANTVSLRPRRVCAVGRSGAGPRHRVLRNGIGPGRSLWPCGTLCPRCRTRVSVVLPLDVCTLDEWRVIGARPVPALLQGRGVCLQDGGPQILLIASGEPDGTRVSGGIRGMDVASGWCLGKPRRVCGPSERPLRSHSPGTCVPQMDST